MAKLKGLLTSKLIKNDPEVFFMSKDSKMSLKSFTEEYTKILNSYNVDQLRSILKNMAAEVASADRIAFIDKLSLRKSNNRQSAKTSDLILQQIELLVEDIQSQSEEEPEWDCYDEEDALGEFSEFIPRIYELFDEIEALFDYGLYPLGRKAFDAIYTIFDIEDDYGRGISISDLETLDVAELQAKYLRSIYLSEQSMTRAKCLFQAMEKLSQLDSYNSKDLKLEDIINISITPLPEWSEFLSHWIKLTKSKPGLQYDTWYREAIYLQAGSSGLEEVAKKEGLRRPRVYIDWVKALIEKKEYTAGLQAISLALEQLPSDQPIRAIIGDFQVICGKKLNNEDIQMDGQWISFEAKPTLAKLITLYKQLNDLERCGLMQRASESIRTYKERIKDYAKNNFENNDGVESAAYFSTSLLMHAYIFSKNYEEAFKLAQKGKVLGWSSSDNPQPLFVGFCLAKAAKQKENTLSVSLKTLLGNILNNSLGWLSGKSDTDLFLELEKIYMALLSESPPISSTMFDWCLKTAETRIDHIVSNQHRGAYDRAALLTVACTEALKLINPDEAMIFFNRIKNKFPRHSSFQAQLKQAMQRYNDPHNLDHPKVKI